MFDQMEGATGFEDPPNFAQGGQLIGNTAKCPGHENRIGMLSIAGEPCGIAAEVFDPGLAGHDAGTGQFERAGCWFNRENFLHLPGQIRKI